MVLKTWGRCHKAWLKGYRKIAKKYGLGGAAQVMRWEKKALKFLTSKSSPLRIYDKYGFKKWWAINRKDVKRTCGAIWGSEFIFK